MEGRQVLWRNARVATCNAGMLEIERGAILTRGERIEWVGEEETLPDRYRSAGFASRDLENAWVTPGLIDCHTHLVFAGTRATEWGQMLGGASYEDIARRGGGIMSTVRATRGASQSELFDQSAARLECLLREGVTAVEIKSGYGLTLADERKMLLVARSLGEHYPVTIRATFLAAHTVPPEFAGRRDEYIDVVTRDWLPALHDLGLVDAVDVFCENIAFDVAQSEKLLVAATGLGLPIHVHAEQLSNIGATRLATRHGALSSDHLEHASQDDIRAMSKAGTAAVLLPTAYLHLAMKKPPLVEALRTEKVAMAVASDCNPGSAPSPSLQLAMALGARLFRLTATETLAGVTRHAARALGDSQSRGIIAPGLVADFAVWNVASTDEISYWMGRNPCKAVVRGGKIVFGDAAGMAAG